MSSAASAVEDAIRIAQDAVRSDESGDFDEAIALYTKAVDLIKLGLQIQQPHSRSARRSGRGARAQHDSVHSA